VLVDDGARYGGCTGQQRNQVLVIAREVAPDGELGEGKGTQDLTRRDKSEWQALQRKTIESDVVNGKKQNDLHQSDLGTSKG
jgi:hypothetical protein